MNQVSEKLSSQVTAPFGYVALWSGSRKAKISVPRTPEKLELTASFGQTHSAYTVASKNMPPEFHRIISLFTQVPYVGLFVETLQVGGKLAYKCSCRQFSSHMQL